MDSGNTNLEVTDYRMRDFFEYDEMELIGLGRVFLLHRRIQAFQFKARYSAIFFDPVQSAPGCSGHLITITLRPCVYRDLCSHVLLSHKLIWPYVLH